MQTELMTKEIKPKAVSAKALKVMKNLSFMTKEDMMTSAPLKVTYISNKRAKIVKWKSISEDSTDCEDS